MIQFNLLPDVKLEFIKTRRMKRLIMLIASIITAISLTVLILLVAIVHGLQKTHLKNLTNDIKNDSETIKTTPEIEKILTVQSQLTSLPDLHEQKPVASRLFTYVGQVTPVDISIAQLNINFTDNTVTVTGAANTLGTVNKFVDTLKYTEFKNAATNENERAFFDVVLSSFGRDARGASYTINFSFKPAIFELNNGAELIIPQGITTRYQSEKPDEGLIQPLIAPEGDGDIPQ